ncbi:MAG TPA: TetR/AcrR family transcriptional regulator [Bacteroidia bacterium]|jgi:AcrR family transcriptional regulator|nr:TetR/AcrR family transcriptional regulator [Bacteroidia bacterium]
MKAKTDTRRYILETALQLFLVKGYKDVSYQDLMQKTGLSKGAIYHHFASKEDILVSVFEFFVQAGEQPRGPSPEEIVKDFASFKKLLLGIRREQFAHFRKMMGGKPLRFNKMLFFLEAIVENKKLKKPVDALMKQELLFLEQCMRGMQKNGKLGKKQDIALLARNLFWMMQGAEAMLFFMSGDAKEKEFIKVYADTLEDFFSMFNF